ncbi:MAG: three-Cys-motif partner protein TcmP [Caldilineaceae bacterium]|nr:three-Cys-motif partner protein TcmP [Caldilineaceae bacterium]
MPPRTTTWQLDDHTLGKHRVLEKYMEAWLPKLLGGSRQVLFIDGFAGPGEYSRGEKGSPIIAVRSLTDHSAYSRMRGQITFMFIEKEPERAQHLVGVVRRYKDKLPENSIRIYNSTFSEQMTKILDSYERSLGGLPPAFVMIDPFGIKGAPMNVIRRVLARPSTEVYISFMHDYIKRFLGTPEFESHLDDLFGCSDWREGKDGTDGKDRMKFLHELYEKCLRRAGAKYVLKFKLYKSERPFYTIFFATQRLEGCDVMKEAMWKTAPFGDYKFKSGTANQLTLGIEPTDFEPLSTALLDEYSHGEWVTIDEVEEFVMSDKTDYHTGHLKRQTLLPMERANILKVDSDAPRSKGHYPPGTRLLFQRPWF